MSDIEDDLFNLSPLQTTGAALAGRRLLWHLPTNQLNLMYMLAAGLVTGPQGFGRKYYLDALSTYPGWIPLFADVIPRPALDLAVSEADHLRRVVAALDLSQLTGPVRILGPDGNIHPLLFPDGLSGREQVLFVPAPLPATWIQAILFASKDDRVATEDEAADYANVPLTAHKRQVKPRLFSGGAPGLWPPAPELLPQQDAPTHDIAAVGAAIGLLFALGNRGDNLVDAARLLADPSPAEPVGSVDPAQDPLLGALHRWASPAGPDPAQDIQGRLLREILQGIVQTKERSDADPASGNLTLDPHQAVLDILAATGKNLAEDKWQAALERLAGDLRGIIGLGSDTVSDLLNRHTKPFSRGLVLFFLREDCQELVDFSQALLTDMDFVVAAVLFGARSGWMGLPAKVRAHPGLREAASHRMAALAQLNRQTELDLGPAPARIQPLRELLGPAERAWTPPQQAAATTLARHMGWGDVMHTRISLGKGDYRLQIDGRGAHLLLDGEVKAVTTEIDQERLFIRLTAAAIPVKLDAQVRAALGRH